MTEEEKPEPEAVEFEPEDAEEPKKPQHPPCPTCTEEWDGEASFCYYCGYQDTDEENPLHPTPALENGIADAAGILSDDDKAVIGQAIGEYPNIPVFFVSFRTPEDQTPAGFAFSLYNDWTVGIDNAERGFLVYYDPGNMRIEIAVGKELLNSSGPDAISNAASQLAVSASIGNITDGFREAVTSIIKK